MDNKQGSIGAGWSDMGKQSPIPTAAERKASAALARKGLPEVRHKIQMRYERVLGVWRITLVDQGSVVRECRFEDDHKVEEMIRRGRGFTCLADRQAVEMGIRQGLGMVTLHLDAEQYGALHHPR
jgi:hypothetical protein